MLRILAIGFALLLAVFAGVLHAQRLDQYAKRAWFTDDGLPHNTVHDILQDDQGYLWMSTWDGIARFNGRTFYAYNRRNTPALKDDGVRALAWHNGILFAATAQSGLVSFDGQQWRHAAADEAVSPRMLVLHSHSSGRLWIGTQDAGLAYFDGERVRAYERNAELKYPWILSLLEDREGSIWIGTARGLHRMIGDQLAPIDDVPESIVFSLGQDRAGKVWVGTDQGLYRSQGKRFERVPLGAFDKAIVSSIFEDRRGQIWLGTQSDGVLRFGASIEQLGADQGLSNNRVLRIFEDREDGMWIATNSGINRLKASPFRVYTRREGLSDDYVRTIHQAPDGTTYIGTSEGLGRYTGGRIEVDARIANGTSVMSVLAAREGSLWVGTYDQGLIQLRGSELTRWTQESGLPFGQVRALLETRDGTIWVGTAGGASRIAGGRIDLALNKESGLPESYVLSLFETSDGRVLIGTVNGMAVLQDGKIVSYRQSDGFPGEDVFDFYEDAIGTVWIATDHGLVRYADDGFVAFGEDQGLADDVVFRIFDDGSGHFWLTSNAGLMQVVQNELTAGPKRLDVRLLGRTDGMSSAQCNGGSQPAGWRDRDGLIWVPTARGVTVFDPTAIDALHSSVAPTPVIEEMQVDEATKDVGQPLSLSPGSKRIALRFAGLSFDQPENLQYRYRLVGFDDGWIEATDRRAAYTNLPPGDYRFEVTAAKRDGVFAEPPAVVEFSLPPRLYETRWFIALMAGSLLALGAAIPGLRARRLRARTRKLSALIDQRTEELRRQNDALARANAEKTNLLDTVRKQSEAFAKQAQEDPLTGLPNRRRFWELLLNAYQSGSPLTVAIADMDHFKRINDDYGHDIGDLVLIAMADLLKQWAGPNRIVARYGGEEFALVFPELNLDDARSAALDLMIRVRQLRIPGLPDSHRLTLSVGLAERKRHTPRELIREADMQLYRAKHAGRDRVAAGEA